MHLQPADGCSTLSGCLERLPEHPLLCGAIGRRQGTAAAVLVDCTASKDGEEAAGICSCPTEGGARVHAALPGRQGQGGGCLCSDVAVG